MSERIQHGGGGTEGRQEGERAGGRAEGKNRESGWEIEEGFSMQE